jgi:4-hydroxy-4-methyl-2-oxoglutarate aldolase
MSLSAINRGVLAAVVDGACRDVEEIRNLKFPVICKGLVPNVGSVSGYGKVNVPIQCAGVVVVPGDIIVADGNRVVVVAKQGSETILQKAEHLLRTESIVQEKIRAGATIGELVNVNEVFKAAFSYQTRAAQDETCDSYV